MSDSSDSDETNESIEEEVSSATQYLETDNNSKSCIPSTILTTYSPQSIKTTDFEDTSSILSLTVDEYRKGSIVREFSREFQKLSESGPINVKLSSELIFKQVECSDCSILRHKTLKADRLAKKAEQHKAKKDVLLQNVLILKRFDEIFDIPVPEKLIKKICFNENLIISFDPGCDIPKNFGGSDLQLNQIDKQLLSDFSEKVGEFSLRIEIGDEQFITYCNNQLAINESIAGTRVTSMVFMDFGHIEEKKTEWYFENEKKIEKSLHVVMENENYVAFLDHKDLKGATSRRGELNLKNSGDFLQDGGIYVLMRYLIIKEFIGNFQFWTMDINGKIGLCKMDVGVERNIIINDIPYRTIRIKKELFRANIKKETSKTYFLRSGHMILHKWKGCSYYIHVDNTLPIPARYEWNLVNNWTNDIILSSQFEDEKRCIKTMINTYLDEHPQIKRLLHDYLLFLLLLKPENVLEYTINYFLNMFRDY